MTIAMIPLKIKIKQKKLPDEPGVYFFYDEQGGLLYIGKATSLKRRVGSYFTKAHDHRIAEMVGHISGIDYMVTPTVIEALVLEANQIKAHKPKYNVLQRDDKSFLYLVVTNEDFPRPVLMRGHELKRLGVNPFRPTLTKKSQEKFLRVFGPYTNGPALRKAMDLVRRFVPWSECQPPEDTGRTRSCFNAHIGKCPGVCSGSITREQYRRVMKQFVLFFEGKKKQMMREMKKEMTRAAGELRFEDATRYRRNLFALEHIQDIALISKSDVDVPYVKTSSDDVIDLEGRIEAYDISNISGTSAVGSMVVFEEGRPIKNKYRKFKIKSVKGANDVAMMEEVMRRRLRRALLYPKAWPLPELMVIDGGKPQVNRVQRVLDEEGVAIPIVGIAKGFDRRQDRLVFDRENDELTRVAKRGKELFQKARDEAHRFAVSYHRTLRRKSSLQSL
jgi:excinuclease ABC subunit C